MIRMPGYFGALTLVLFLGMVLTRAAMLRRRGIEAINFGKLDKIDFLIPPFVLFYFYLVFASAFGLPTLGELEDDLILSGLDLERALRFILRAIQALTVKEASEFNGGKLLCN